MTVASSTPLRGLKVNCIGSSTLSVIKISDLTNFSMFFIKIEVKARGLKSLKILGPLDLGLGPLQHPSRLLVHDVCNDLLKMSWNMGLSSFVQDAIKHPQILSVTFLDRRHFLRRH